MLVLSRARAVQCIFSHVVDRHATGFTESLIIESCLSDFEDVPVVPVELLVNIYNIEAFVLHKNNQLCFLFGRH